VTLRTALNAAVRQRKISWNPCAGVEIDTPKSWTAACLSWIGPSCSSAASCPRARLRQTRGVFLDHDTAELVGQHRDAQVLQALEADTAWQDNDLVFCQPDGRPWNPDYVTKRFKRLAAQAGVPALTPHDGRRHTGNSLKKDADVDQELRMPEVGHSDKSVNDPYTHVLEETHLAAAEQVAALVRKAGDAQ
jgi:integrase